MQATLSIIRYPKSTAVFGFFSMLLFRLPLSLNKGISFYRLMGSSKNGIFQMKPDFLQWGIFTVYSEDRKSSADGFTAMDAEHGFTRHYGRFINRWFRFFKCDIWTVVLEPVSGHGSWDGHVVFPGKSSSDIHPAPVAILTRATIRLNKLGAFWKATAHLGNEVMNAHGLMVAFGLGEMPYLRQVTFSAWNNMENMESFAYHNSIHKEAMQSARLKGWFKEDMFYRFRITGAAGSLNGKDPLGGLL